MVITCYLWNDIPILFAQHIYVYIYGNNISGAFFSRLDFGHTLADVEPIRDCCLWNTCKAVTRSRRQIHDDVIKWKPFPRYWTFMRIIRRSPVNSPHKGQWQGALMFSLIYVCINGWVNNREAGDLRRHRAHCEVSVMVSHPLYPGDPVTVWSHSSPRGPIEIHIPSGTSTVYWIS